MSTSAKREVIWTAHEDRPGDAWWTALDGAHADVWRKKSGAIAWFVWQVTDAADRTVKMGTGMTGEHARETAARVLERHVALAQSRARMAGQMALLPLEGAPHGH